MIDAVVMGNVNLRTVGLIMAGNARPTKNPCFIRVNPSLNFKPCRVGIAHQSSRMGEICPELVEWAERTQQWFIYDVRFTNYDLNER